MTDVSMATINIGSRSDYSRPLEITGGRDGQGALGYICQCLWKYMVAHFTIIGLRLFEGL